MHASLEPLWQANLELSHEIDMILREGKARKSAYNWHEAKKRRQAKMKSEKIEKAVVQTICILPRPVEDFNVAFGDIVGCWLLQLYSLSSVSQVYTSYNGFLIG